MGNIVSQFKDKYQMVFSGTTSATEKVTTTTARSTKTPSLFVTPTKSRKVTTGTTKTPELKTEIQNILSKCINPELVKQTTDRDVYGDNTFKPAGYGPVPNFDFFKIPSDISVTDPKGFSYLRRTIQLQKMVINDLPDFKQKSYLLSLLKKLIDQLNLIVPKVLDPNTDMDYIDETLFAKKHWHSTNYAPKTAVDNKTKQWELDNKAILPQLVDSSADLTECLKTYAIWNTFNGTLHEARLRYNALL